MILLDSKRKSTSIYIYIYRTLIESTAMADGVTCMAFTVSFLPNTGNKYFMAACDESLRLYDFEEAQLLRTFDEMYSSYCDCGKFITWLDEPKKEEEEEDKDKMDQDDTTIAPYSYFISRGAEMCDVDEGVCKLYINFFSSYFPVFHMSKYRKAKRRRKRKRRREKKNLLIN